MLRNTLLLMTCAGMAMAAGRPNIIFLPADDLGYGELGCLNPEDKIAGGCSAAGFVQANDVAEIVINKIKGK